MSEARELPLFVVRHGRAEGVLQWAHSGREHFRPEVAAVRCPQLRGAAAASVESDPVVAARIEDAPVEVAPGERVALKLNFRLPEKLTEPRYAGQILIAGEPLHLTVLRGAAAATAAPSKSKRS